MPNLTRIPDCSIKLKKGLSSAPIYKSPIDSSEIIGEMKDGATLTTDGFDSTTTFSHIKQNNGWVKTSQTEPTISPSTKVPNNKAEQSPSVSNPLNTQTNGTVNQIQQSISSGNKTNTSSNNIDTTVNSPGSNALTGDNIQSTDGSGLSYEPNLDDYDIGASVESFLDFKQIDGIFGMPYQYTPSVDRRLSGSNNEMEYGRKYTEKIVMNAPLLFLTPGRPQFMSGFSQEYKQTVAQKLFDFTGVSDDSISDISEGRYYTFKFAYDEYYSYVNVMCQRAASMLGIGDEKFNGVPLKRYNWADYKNDNLKTFISGSEYVTFYIEAETQVSESFGNSTGESALASSINKMSEYGKEASFLMGSLAGVELDAAIRSGYQSNLQAFSDFFNKWGGDGPASIANKLFGGVSALAMGGHIAFPEIWKDSDYSQAYNITVKFATPDGDRYSQFINIMVPYYHLLGFVMPQALGFNEYTSPFLVRGSYGGVFNCEMGIITSMDVSKGPSWNQFKMPTEMTVTFTIKDLYKALYMTNTTSVSKFLKHAQFVDFLANSVGVNLNMPEIGRTLHLYKDFHVGTKVTTALDNMQNSFNNFLSNQASKLTLLY